MIELTFFLIESPEGVTSSAVTRIEVPAPQPAGQLQPVKGALEGEDQAWPGFRAGEMDAAGIE
jgi:hypothetical protein